MESKIVEEIANDVLGKLKRVFVGDLDEQIKTHEQLAKLQMQYFKGTPHSEHWKSYQTTVHQIRKLQMERHQRLLRIPSNMSSQPNDSNASNDFYDIWSNVFRFY